jgi:prophage regulatory protein
MTRIIREREMKNITGLSRITRWRLETRGEFPRKIKLSERAIGWKEDEVLQWLQERTEAR